MKKTNTTHLFLTVLFAISIVGCVQEKKAKTIRFMVDMRGQAPLSHVGIRGSSGPFSWEETRYLSDPDGDGIYEGSFQFSSASPGIEFKFVREGDVFELDCQPNRNIPFEYQPEVLTYTGVFDQAEGFTIERESL
jgi:hypothetical protein